jgi:hypothetical protein
MFLICIERLAAIQPDQNSSTSAASEPATISRARNMLSTLIRSLFLFFFFARVVTFFSF